MDSSAFPLLPLLSFFPVTAAPNSFMPSMDLPEASVPVTGVMPFSFMESLLNSP